MSVIINRPTFINALSNALLTDALPGHEAHYKMAHAVRKVEPNPDPALIKHAAVLITFYQVTPGDWHIIFIRRSASHDQDKHAGQIAFPGGKREPLDRDLTYTALRETEEETGMDLEQLDVLGSLTPLYITVSKFMVHPFVAFSYHIPVLTRQEKEVDEILRFPLADFLNPASHTETRIRLGSGIVLNHVPAYRIQGNIIWGATAMIMSELLEVLGRFHR